MQNVVDPITLKIWTRFTHELNRITGGMGYSITYNLEIPSVTEDEKIQAEKQQIYMNTISAAAESGFDIGSTIKAIQAPDYRDWETDRKSTRLNSSHSAKSRMPSSA